MRAVSLPAATSARLFSGVASEAVVAVTTSLIVRENPPVAVVFLPNQREIERWAQDLPFLIQLLGKEGTVHYETLPEIPDSDADEPAVPEGEGGTHRAVVPEGEGGPRRAAVPEGEGGTHRAVVPEGEGGRQFEATCDRLAALTRLAARRRGTPPGDSLFILTTPRGFFHPVPRPDALASREIRLRKGDSLPFSDFQKRLASELGYDSETVCEAPGQYAVRGGLVDVYPVNGTEPLRIDFFGDEVDEIRAYDPTTQRSVGEREEAVIAAVRQPSAQERESHIYAYFPPETSWILPEPGRLERDFPGYCQVPERIPTTQPTFEALIEARQDCTDRFVGIQEIDDGPRLFAHHAEADELTAEGLDGYRETVGEESLGMDRLEWEATARDRFISRLAEWSDEGLRIVAVSHNDAESDRLREVLREHEEGRRLEPEFRHAEMTRGFLLRFGEHESVARAWARDNGAAPATGIVVVTDGELFGRYRNRPAGLRRRKRVQRAQVDQLLDFSDLVEGDHLVHLSHGICRYRGLNRMELRGRLEEVITVEFDDAMLLHLPLYEAHLLTRYVGLAKVRPRLGKLGGNQWDKTRRAAERATLDFAAQLLRLQAEREDKPGFAFGADSTWQTEFESAFIHRETRDQMQAIVESKADMEKTRPMDRLICGDVGFGKTEVAMRAAFKAVQDSKQVAVLVPTTVLAQQHLISFRERMADYPVSIEMLSRFRSRQQQSEILRQAADGRIDILIGTHRLLSRDVHFRDLGLLIVDEEHRFGVRHKERIKELRAHIDIISMSATPIPRTLYLALTGARDLSVIDTPPIDRLPIHTVVKPYSLDLVKKAIHFELDRGGQVFYLHNRVQTIDSVALRLQELLPEARIAIGHGQMTENALEKIMTRFVAGEFDILVCTTIIESGLDIPNCNTIIIEGADRFGLSQLYQLRGRVGRFKRQAYAYLLLHRHTRIVDQARKRLSAMRQYNQLGAGFRIAMRDLELRGAGNLLGVQQSGHIAGVGFDLYCQLLRQSISRLKGDTTAQAIRATVRLDFVRTVDASQVRGEVAGVGFNALKQEELGAGTVKPIEAALPAGYISETRLRIDLYRRLALADSVTRVNDIAAEIRDRFGKPPKPVNALLQVTRIRCLAEERRVLSVESEGSRLILRRASGKRDDFIKIGSRFPRLTARSALSRLDEVQKTLKRYAS